MTHTVRECGYPVGRSHRPLGWTRHLGAVATSGAAVPALQIAFARGRRQRLERLSATARDLWQQRRAPTRPTMRSLIARPGGRMQWCDVPAPRPPGPGEAIVHPIAAATCDIDRAMALGRTPFLLPMHFGHECVAEVVEVGDNVSTVRRGDRVVVPFQISCGRCGSCRAGLTSNCESVPPISMFGFGLSGGHWGGTFSDLVAVPFADGMLVPLPPDVTPVEAASVADNVADGFRAVAPHLPMLLERDQDLDVLILADVVTRPPFSASVALYAGLTALALGARTVHFVDRRPYVRRHAEALGMHAHPPRDLRGIGVSPLVVDTTGVSAGIATAIKHTAPDGVCSSLASLARTSALPTALMYGRNITLHLGRSDARTHIPAILDLMQTGRLKPDVVTTHVDTFDHADRAVRSHILGEATKTIVVE